MTEQVTTEVEVKKSKKISIKRIIVALALIIFASGTFFFGYLYLSTDTKVCIENSDIDDIVLTEEIEEEEEVTQEIEEPTVYIDEIIYQYEDVRGYLVTTEGRTVEEGEFEGMVTPPHAYFRVTSFDDFELKKELDETINIDPVNRADLKVGNDYLVRLGCFEGDNITQDAFDELEDEFIDQNTLTKILSSTVSNQINLRVYWRTPLGRDCECCNIGYKYRVR